MAISNERTLHNLEQLELIMREIPLFLQPIIPVQSVQLGAYGKMGPPAMSYFSTLRTGKFVAGQFPTTGTGIASEWPVIRVRSTRIPNRSPATQNRRAFWGIAVGE